MALTAAYGSVSMLPPCIRAQEVRRVAGMRSLVQEAACGGRGGDRACVVPSTALSTPAQKSKQCATAHGDLRTVVPLSLRGTGKGC